jgi:hypothetical protein
LRAQDDHQWSQIDATTIIQRLSTNYQQLAAEKFSISKKSCSLHLVSI